MNGTVFPECRHAGEVRGQSIRDCGSPKLWGLKVVSPKHCEDCFCRDHNDEASLIEPLPEPCAFLGQELTANPTEKTGIDPTDSQARFACDHANHDIATSASCRKCSDYLFPIVTPTMSIESVVRLMRAPYRMQPEGWTRWENVQQAFHQIIKDAVREDPGPIEWSDERGIVIVGGGRYFDSTYVTIRVIRQLGCRLPIELWHLDGEVDDDQRAKLARFDVSFRNADSDEKTREFRFLNGHWWKGWQLKAVALRYCSFREVLLLDSDCYPVKNPEVLFDWQNFQHWGAVFWPDLEMNRQLIQEEAWGAFQVSPLENLPTESGQILINRDICSRELHLASRLNQHADLCLHVSLR